MRFSLTLLLMSLSFPTGVNPSGPVRFRAHVIEAEIPSGYSVLVADINNDRRPDVVGLTSRLTELAWYENPSWERHVLVRNMNGMVNMAAHDIDGDGIPELALQNEFGMVAAESQGLVWLLRHQGDPRMPWKAAQVDALTTSHHLAWADVDGDGKKELINAPLIGPKALAPRYEDQVPLVYYQVPKGLQGESLVPLIHGQDPLDDRAIFSEHREDPIVRRMGLGSGVMVSLRSGRWKFILNEKSSQMIEKPRFELFDLDEDPGEQDNVADVYPDVVKGLELQVMTFIADHWQGASANVSTTMDPEVLEQLRALGYVGEEEDAPDLWEAMESEDPEQVRRSLAAGANANELDEVFGVRPLSMAAMAGNLELAQALLAGGADVDALNQDGSSPLSGAAFFGRVELLEYLLDQGADPDAKSGTGETALSATKIPWDVTEFLADLLQVQLDRDKVETGRRQCAELLVFIENTNNPTARLFEAIGAGNVKAVEQSLAQGASLEDWDAKRGWTPLYMAVFRGREGIARLLLEQGAKVHTRNKDKGSTLHGAALLGHVSLVELLIEHGADVDARDGKGSTPLHAAAFLGRVETVECLLREAADQTMKNEDGQTALDVTRTDWEVTELVIQLLGLDLERVEVEKNRAQVTKLLRG